MGYAWDFGGGDTAAGAATDHTYAAEGAYTVSLTVTDDEGATDDASEEVPDPCNEEQERAGHGTRARFHEGVRAAQNLRKRGAWSGMHLPDRASNESVPSGVMPAGLVRWLSTRPPQESRPRRTPPANTGYLIQAPMEGPRYGSTTGLPCLGHLSDSALRP